MARPTRAPSRARVRDWLRGGLLRGACFGAVAFAAQGALADVPARPLVAALARAGLDAPVRSLEAAAKEAAGSGAGAGAGVGLGVLLESDTPIADAVRVNDGVYFVRRPLSELEQLLARHAGARAH